MIPGPAQWVNGSSIASCSDLIPGPGTAYARGAKKKKKKESMAKLRCGLNTKKSRKLLEVTGRFYILMAMIVAWVYTYVKSHSTIHLKLVHFISCKF